MITHNPWLFEAPLVHETASYGNPYTQQEYYNSALGEQEWGVIGEFETGSRPVGPHREVNTPLPRSGRGFVSYASTGRQFALPETIRALRAIGVAWQRNRPQGPRIGIGDISFQGGRGPMKPHKAHRHGFEVDIRPVRNDGKEGGTTSQEPTYSRILTQELVNIIHSNGVLRVKDIFFNDPNINGVRHLEGHDNHLHVRFLPSSGGPISPPSRQKPVHHRNPALGLQSSLPSLTTPALSTPTKWMGSKPLGTTLYVSIPLGSEEPGTTPMTGIFLPHGYRTQQKVDILLYLHGHKIALNQPNNRWSVDWYWQNGPIGAFREELNNSSKNVVLVMPTLSRKSNPGWLVKPGGLDRYLDMVMAALSTYGPYRGKHATVGNIILAGHSGAGLYMRKLAHSKHRYSPLIRECWGFDCMYNGDDAYEWSKWARQNPKAKLYNYYIRGTLTRIQSEALPKLPNISVTPLNNRPYRSDLHHWVPITYWRTRIEQASFLKDK